MWSEIDSRPARWHGGDNNGSRCGDNNDVDGGKDENPLSFLVQLPIRRKPTASGRMRLQTNSVLAIIV
jgi:hypothetical protein